MLLLQIIEQGSLPGQAEEETITSVATFHRLPAALKMLENARAYHDQCTGETTRFHLLSVQKIAGLDEETRLGVSLMLIEELPGARGDGE